MIHYHGMSTTGSHRDVMGLAQGRHIFISYADHGVLPRVASVASSFALDNGAFSAWKSGRPMDYDGFVEFVRKWHRHPAFDWACIPDVIDGDERVNDEWLDRWPDDLIGVPVWHLHESIDRLVRIASVFKRIAFGSSGEYSTPRTQGWWRRIGEAMEAICVNGQPICKLHGMRMLDPQIFTRLPLSSADSTNAERTARRSNNWGAFAPPTKGQRASVIAWRVESNQSAEVWEPSPQMELDLAI